MKYRVTDLRNFIEASTCTTIVQAARKLEISQPALSESIKKLESDLGSTLFYRSRSGIQLTPSGRIFLSKAQKVIQALHELDFVREDENVFAGRTITIGCHTTVAQYTIPKALSFLKEKAPDYRIELKHDLSRNIQSEIQKGHIDIGIVINATEVPDIVIRKLAIDQVGVWSAKSVNDSDAIICNLNLFQTQSILKKWKNKPEKIISTDSLELICQLVENKIGYGILPERAVRLSGFSFKNHSTLPTYKDDICLLYRPEFGKSLPEQLVIQALSKALL